MSGILKYLIAGVVLSAAVPVLADDPAVEGVEIEKAGMVWNVHVTLRHPDSGWDHYADGWEVLDESGRQLGFRKLMHPHVEEQPFTRALSGVVIPDGTRKVYVRSRCSKDGWAEDRTAVKLRP